jgi:hypothetical protein
MSRSPLSLVTSPYDRPVNTMARSPTLGCQIAPTYHHDAWISDSDSSSDGDSGGSAGAQEQVEDGQPDVEKVETARDTELARPSGPTPLQTGRTRSSRRMPLPEPVGFWHWSMVRILYSKQNTRNLSLLGWRQAARYQAVAANK